MDVQRAMNLETMSKDERSLLLYFETCMVDNRGKVDGRRMNAADHEIVKEFVKQGLITFQRLPFKHITELKDKAQVNAHYWITFSDKAWELAHQERRNRSDRMIKKDPMPFTPLRGN